MLIICGSILVIEIAQEVLPVAPDELSQLFDNFIFGHAVNLDDIFSRVRASAQEILRYNAGTRRTHARLCMLDTNHRIF
jgi:hypothetical protein